MKKTELVNLYVLIEVTGPDKYKPGDITSSNFYYELENVPDYIATNLLVNQSIYGNDFVIYIENGLILHDSFCRECLQYVAERINEAVYGKLHCSPEYTWDFGADTEDFRDIRDRFKLSL